MEVLKGQNSVSSHISLDKIVLYHHKRGKHQYRRSSPLIERTFFCISSFVFSSLCSSPWYMSLAFSPCPSLIADSILESIPAIFRCFDIWTPWGFTFSLLERASYTSSQIRTVKFITSTSDISSSSWGIGSKSLLIGIVTTRCPCLSSPPC